MSIHVKALSVRFYCRESKRRSDGRSPIEMSVNLGGERFFTRPSRKERPENFNRLLKQRKPNALKDYLKAIEMRILEYETECLRAGELMKIEGLKEFIEAGFTKRVVSIQTLLDDFFTTLRQKRDTGAMTSKRYRKYEIAVNYFMEGTGIKATDPLSCIRNKTIQDFKYYLVGRKFEPITISGFLQCVKSLILFGLRNGLLKENPFAGIKISRIPKNVLFLTEEEIGRIKNRTMFNERLEKSQRSVLVSMLYSLVVL